MPLRETSTAYLRYAEGLRDNPGQWAAYNSTGHCVVLAGPGSGKTKTLVLKLARMLAEDVRVPHGVACITYSQECARELGRRLEAIGLGNHPNLFVGTVHGFCLRHILMPYAHLAGLVLPSPITLATTLQMETTFRRAGEAVLGLNQPYKSFAMGKYRRTHLDRRVASWNSDPDMVRIIEEYERSLRRQGLIDFDDLVVLGNQLIAECDWVLPIIAAKFPILAVDEYQDLGRPLHSIVKRLAFDAGVRLFAVGDADQSIYGFTGADGDLLLELADRDDVEPVRLDLNYRSGGEIIRASEMILGEERGYRSNDDTKRATISFVERPAGLEDQAAYVVDTIIPAVLAAKPGRKIGDIAILYRAADVGDVMAAAATSGHLDFIRVDNAAPYKKVGLTSWVEDCAAWCAGGWQTAKPQLRGLIDRWIGFRSGNLSQAHARDEAVRLTAFLLSQRADGTAASPFVSAIASELIDPLVGEEPSLADQYEQIVRMRKAFATNGALADLSLANLGGRDGSPDHLNLLTLHSAKGCEYDVVIMIGMDKGSIPWKNETDAELRESRRLFYVGVTRAREAVYVLYSGWVQGRFGVQRLGRSPFVEELQDRLATAKG
jgi:DNA helicase-2/ATP-dependent DNA helicase PcrA